MLAKFFFAYFFKDQGKVKVEKKCNKEQGQYAAISPDQAWTINGLIIWLNVWTTQEFPSRQGGPFLPCLLR